MTTAQMCEKTASSSSTTNISTGLTDEFDNATAAGAETSDVSLLPGVGETESHGTGVDGVLGVVSAPRSRRGDGRRRQRDGASGNSPRTLSKGGASPPVKARGPWLDVRAVAAYLAMRERAVRDLWRRGILPGRRFGGSVRFSLQELDDFLVKNRQATLDELSSRARVVSSSPLGPLMSPEDAATYMGLASTGALLKRTERLQVPVYRISARILRFSASDLDAALSENALTSSSRESTIQGGACLPEGKEVHE